MPQCCTVAPRLESSPGSRVVMMADLYTSMTSSHPITTAVGQFYRMFYSPEADRRAIVLGLGLAVFEECELLQ